MIKYLYFCAFSCLFLANITKSESLKDYFLSNHDIYINGKNLYLKSKEKIILLHGDIITPITTNTRDFEIYPSNSRAITSGIDQTCYEKVCIATFSQRNKVATKNLLSSGYKLSNNTIEFYKGNFDNNGIHDLVIVNNELRQLVYAIKDLSNDYKPNKIQDISDYIEVSDSQIEITDRNNDGRDDIAVFKDGNITKILYANSNGVFAKPNPINTVGPNIINTVVGTLPDNTKVTKSGAANYQVPIEVPPGVNGLQPALALVYDSQQRNGLLGLGWTLTGFPTISRCSTTLAQDGFIDGVDFDNNDKFCLDSHRLIAVNGAYGGSGTEYRTEYSSYKKIVSLGTSANGPAYFKVWYKDGRIAEFGNSNNSRIEAQGKADTIAWTVNKIEDRFGNSVNYRYSENNTTGEYYIHTIDYTNTSIKFEYEDKPDKTQFFTGGSLSQVNRRLKHINIKQSSKTKSIKLFYKQAAATNISLLTSIQECTSRCKPATKLKWNLNNQRIFSTATSILNTRKFKSTSTTKTTSSTYNTCDVQFGTTYGSGVTINYNGSTYEYLRIKKEGADIAYLAHYNSSQNKIIKCNNITNTTNHITTRQPITQVIDVNGDGVDDVISFTDDGVYASYSSVNGLSQPELVLAKFGYNQGWRANSHPRMLGDVNGDGLIDIIGFASNGVYISFSNGDGFTSPKHVLSQFGENAGGWSVEQHPRLVSDINGDGMIDIIGFASNGVYISYSTGNGFTPAKHILSAFGNNQGWNNDNHLRRLGDVNGDGLTDIIGFANNGVYVSYSTGNGFTPAKHVLSAFGNNQGWSNDNHPRQLGDANGDGLTDIIGFASNGVYVSYSTGNGFTPAKHALSEFGQNTGVWSVKKHPRLLGDVNGDGMTDIVGFANNGVYISYSTSNGFMSAKHAISAFGYDQGWSIENNSRLLGDINGDGMADIIGVNDEGIKVSQSTLPTTVISQITNGFGHITKLSYKPLTDQSIFTKSTTSQYPILDSQPSAYVVSKVEKANGIGGFTTTTYQYEGLKFHQQGLGSLGFAKVTSTQVETGIQIINEYAQDAENRKIGLPTRSQTLSKNGVVLKDNQQNWQATKLSDGDISRYQTLLASTTTTQKSLRDELLSTVTHQLTYDEFSNLTNRETTTTDKYGHYTQTINTQYNNDESQWLLGLAKRTTDTRTNSISGSTTTRIRSQEYDTTTGALVKQMVEPDNPDLMLTTDYTYDRFGNQIKIVKSGHLIKTTTDTFTYDEAGRLPVNSTNSLKHTVSQINDPFWGVPLTSTDANGITSTNSYDSFGRLMKVDHPTGSETVTTRGWCKNSGHSCPTRAVYWVQVKTTGESPKRVYFDQLAREIRTVTAGLDGTKIYVDTDYNALNKIQRKSVPYYAGEQDLYWNQYQYDDLLRPTKKIAPNGNITTIAYNGLTQVYTNAKNQTKTVNKNALGQLMSVADTHGQLLNYQYDSFGNLVDTRDPLGNATHITYDVLGRKIAMNDPDKGEWQYAYDALGRLVRQQDAKGQVTTLEYDVLGRMQQRVDHAQKKKEQREVSTWQYDQQKKGLVDSITGPNFSHQLKYDDLSRVISTTQVAFSQSFTLQQTYDALGRPEKTIYPTGLISQKVYNEHGFLGQITDGKTESPKVYWQATSADPYGNVTTATLGNGYENIRYVNQQTGRVDSIVAHLNNVSFAADYKYTYDTLGNLIQRADKDFNQGQGIVENFTFDELNRLTSSTVTIGDEAPVTQQVTYDVLGNITSKSDVGNYTYGGSCNGVTAGPHAVTQTQGVESTTYCYDKNGNMISGNDRTIIYTSFDKPNYITKGSASTTIDYGADRARIRRIDNTSQRGSSQTSTTYYMGGVYEKVEANGQTKHKHYIADVAIVTQTEGGESKTNYLHRDHLSSVVSITDENGQVIERNSFDPWGKKRQKNWKPAKDYTTLVSSITTRGFTNHEHLDAVGLIHMNGRVYDPNLARFLSADPFIQAPSILQSFNRYTYGFNNPLSMTDPSGFTAIPNFSYINNLYDSAINQVINYNRPTPLRPGFNYNSQTKEIYQSNLPSQSWTSWRAPLRENIRVYNSPQIALKNNTNVANNYNHSSNGTIEPYQDPSWRNTFILGDLINDMGNTIGTFTTGYNPFTGYGVTEQEKQDSLFYTFTGLATGGLGRAYASTTGSLRRLFKSCNCCFAPGTPVLTAEGNQPIETIKKGQLVYAKNPETGEVSLKPVTERIINEGKPTYSLTLKDNSGVEKSIEVTDNHPFRVMGQGWVDSIKLEPGMKVEAFEGESLEIVSIQQTGRTEDTYNITVADFHTYYAGEQQVFVHNCDCYDMALGLARHTTTRDPLMLRKFAKLVGAKTYGEINGSWWPDKDRILNAMKSAKSLHFNLDQFDMSRFKDFTKNPVYGEDNITNWELHNVLTDKSLLEKTTFYGPGGKVIDPPSL